METIVIIGAGITGLTLGWLLKRNEEHNKKIILLEGCSDAGGWIQTIDCDGYSFELGPRSCRPKGNGRYTLTLAEELGLADQVIIGSPQAKKRFLYYNQTLQPLPHNIFSFVTSPLMKGVIPSLIKEWRRAPSSCDDETIDSFVSRRFGRLVAEKFFDPMTSGIYAGDIRKLSVKSCFPFLYELEKKHGSVMRGLFFKDKEASFGTPFVQSMQKHSLFSFKTGMSALISELRKRLEENIRFNSKVKTLQNVNNSFSIELENGEILKADTVYSCIPAHALAKIIHKAAPSLAVNLEKIDTATVSTVSLGYDRRVMSIEGFGHLVPQSEGEDILGVVWDSSVFPEHNRTESETRLTVMIGGKNREDLLIKNEDQILDIALKSVHKHLGINTKPNAIHINTAKNAIPQYNLGHSNLIEEIEKNASELLSSNFKLLGNSFRGVAINDCIAQAYKTLGM